MEATEQKLVVIESPFSAHTMDDLVRNVAYAMVAPPPLFAPDMSADEKRDAILDMSPVDPVAIVLPYGRILWK